MAVVIPCFNDGALLGEAVRSALKQDRIDELVVVDDGSTDPGTLAAFGELEQEGVRVVHQRNGGVGAARMSGVTQTTSDYVLCLDADDRLLPGALSKLAQALDDDSTVALVWGDYQLFGERTWVQATAPDLDPWQISFQNDIPASMMIRRSVLMETGGWQSVSHEDWDLLMALAEAGARGCRLPTAIYEYRQHGLRAAGIAASHHGDVYELLRNRHPALFSQRRTSWRRSRSPWLLKLAVPLIFALPLQPNHQRLLAGAACHLAHRRGMGLLFRRTLEVSYNAPSLRRGKPPGS